MNTKQYNTIIYSPSSGFVTLEFHKILLKLRQISEVVIWGTFELVLTATTRKRSGYQWSFSYGHISQGKESKTPGKCFQMKKYTMYLLIEMSWNHKASQQFFLLEMRPDVWNTSGGLLQWSKIIQILLNWLILRDDGVWHVVPWVLMMFWKWPNSSGLRVLKSSLPLSSYVLSMLGHS